MPLLNITLRCCWFEILPSKKSCSLPICKEEDFMTESRQPLTLQPVFPSAEQSQAAPSCTENTLSHAQLAVWPSVCATIPGLISNTPQLAHTKNVCAVNHGCFSQAARLLITLKHAAPPTKKKTTKCNKKQSLGERPRCDPAVPPCRLSCQPPVYVLFICTSCSYHSRVFHSKSCD